MISNEVIGFVLVDNPDHHYVRGWDPDLFDYWEETRDWKHMELGESHFVPCTTVKECIKHFQERNIPDIDVGEFPFLGLARQHPANYGGIQVAKAPVVDGSSIEVHRLAAAVRRYGPVFVSNQLRWNLVDGQNREYKASDLVVKSVPGGCQFPWQLRIDTRIARGRRTRAAKYEETKAKRRQEAEEINRRRMEAVRIRDALDELWTGFTDRTRAAYTAVWDMASKKTRDTIGFPPCGLADAMAWIRLLRPSALDDRRDPIRHPKVVAAINYLFRHKKLVKSLPDMDYCGMTRYRYELERLLPEIVKLHPDFTLPEKVEQPLPVQFRRRLRRR